MTSMRIWWGFGISFGDIMGLRFEGLLPCVLGELELLVCRCFYMFVMFDSSLVAGCIVHINHVWLVVISGCKCKMIHVDPWWWNGGYKTNHCGEMMGIWPATWLGFVSKCWIIFQILPIEWGRRWFFIMGVIHDLRTLDSYRNGNIWELGTMCLLWLTVHLLVCGLDQSYMADAMLLL